MDRHQKSDASTEAAPKAPSVRKGGRSRINAIYQTMRDRICFFEYPPTMVLKEVALAQEFGVSRTPIRQILQRLESEKLVEIRDGVGTIVTGVDFRRLKDVYELRLRISEIMADFIQKANIPQALAEIQALIARAEKLREEPDLRTFWIIENDRHRLLNRLISNEPLRELHDSLYMQTARVWYDIVESVWPEALEALHAELAELRRALELGDTRAIGWTARNYIAYSMSRLSRHFDPT
ncbi:GntR family transcriptional regulator [Rhodoligotrophos defluvii]|uniref:GntR family transcriptional regulator n=1 Tax=Rhodoligotrophos defluvii TaxID=2561934 RepID=UPI0014856F88|nr:GntR family transcriptional regulator [Rhodoligotrophos defluvii]